MKTHWQRLREHFFRPVDCSTLGLFRFCFGFLVAWQVFDFFDAEFVETYFISAPVNFHFALFDTLHLPVWPPNAMHLHFILMGTAALLIAFGFFFRTAICVFFLTFLYAFLFEMGIYNNHYYLILLLSAIFLFTNADRWASVRAVSRREKLPSTIPYWQLFLIRVQVGVVYFFGAVAKMNHDWVFRAQPMYNFLYGHADTFPLFREIWVAHFFSVGGLLIDLILGLIYFSGKGRGLALFLILFFNITNTFIFGRVIGVFPLFMISTYFLLMEPSQPRQWFQRLKLHFSRQEETVFSTAYQTPEESHSPRYKNAVTFVVVCYLVVQFFVPLRHWLYPGHVAWTFEGYRFAWRMKLDVKKVDFSVKIVDPATGTEYYHTNFNDVIRPHQAWASDQPDMFLQYIHAIRDDFIARGIKDPEVYWKADASLNFRPMQPFIDGSVDLANESYPLFSHADWIIPLEK